MKSFFNKLAHGIVLGGFLTSQMAISYNNLISLPYLYDPQYQKFASLVRQYKIEKLMNRWGRDNAEQVLSLEFTVMTHPAKPDFFTLADLGRVGCLPSFPNKSDFPQSSVCHVFTIRDKQEFIPSSEPEII